MTTRTQHTTGPLTLSEKRGPNATFVLECKTDIPDILGQVAYVAYRPDAEYIIHVWDSHDNLLAAAEAGLQLAKRICEWIAGDSNATHAVDCPVCLHEEDEHEHDESCLDCTCFVGIAADVREQLTTAIAKGRLAMPTPSV